MTTCPVGRLTLLGLFPAVRDLSDRRLWRPVGASRCVAGGPSEVPVVPGGCAGPTVSLSGPEFADLRSAGLLPGSHWAWQTGFSLADASCSDHGRTPASASVRMCQRTVQEADLAAETCESEVACRARPFERVR